MSRRAATATLFFGLLLTASAPCTQGAELALGPYVRANAAREAVLVGRYGLGAELAVTLTHVRFSAALGATYLGEDLGWTHDTVGPELGLSALAVPWRLGRSVGIGFGLEGATSWLHQRFGDGGTRGVWAHRLGGVLSLELRPGAGGISYVLSLSGGTVWAVGAAVGAGRAAEPYGALSLSLLFGLE